MRMQDIVAVSIREFGTLLQGRICGSRHLGRLCAELAAAAKETTVVLDFTGVKCVTGSWINAVIVPLLRWSTDRELFPMLRNMKDEWLDDLALVADLANQCYLVVGSKGATPERAQVVGRLEPAQKAALQAVMMQPKGVTGASLAREMDARIGPTAWNNRLRDLHERRLIRREANGREHLYHAIVKEITIDGRQLSATTR